MIKMDIEGFVKRNLKEGKDDAVIIAELRNRIREIKPNIHPDSLDRLSKAVLEEAKRTMKIDDELLGAIESGVHMGEFGVGSRGAGDFYVHEKIGELIGATDAVVDSSALSDSGVVQVPGQHRFIDRKSVV